MDDADRVYHELRRLGMPVFRWDRIWPHTPVLPNDCSPHWRGHLLQLLCHQDLRVSDIDTVCRELLQLLASTRASSALATLAADRA